MESHSANELDLITRQQTESALVEAAWQRIKTHLEAEKRRINDEINQYPPPIPACDVQFNYLLEQRASIAQEIQRMHTASVASLCCNEPEKPLIEFIQTSSFIDAEARQRFTFDVQ